MIWSEKLGHEIGTYNSLGGLRINPVTCRICKGTGLNAITHESGLVTLNKCVLCKGIKHRSNKI